MDVISWDNYPRYDTPWSETAMCHDLAESRTGVRALVLLFLRRDGGYKLISYRYAG